jgi:hypothetical protein
MLYLFPTHFVKGVKIWVGKRSNIVEVFLFHNQVWKKPFPDPYFHGLDEMSDSETRRGCQSRRGYEWNQEIRDQAGEVRIKIFDGNNFSRKLYAPVVQNEFV